MWEIFIDPREFIEFEIFLKDFDIDIAEFTVSKNLGWMLLHNIPHEVKVLAKLKFRIEEAESKFGRDVYIG